MNTTSTSANAMKRINIILPTVESVNALLGLIEDLGLEISDKTQPLAPAA